MTTKSRAARTPESVVLADVMAYLKARGCIVHRRNTGAAKFRNEGDDASRFVRFSEVGSSDLWAIRSEDGVHLEIETKAPGKRPTFDQVQWLIAHNGVGGSAAFWVDSVHILARVYDHLLAGGRVVYLDTTREYRVKRGRRVATVIGPSGDYDLA